MTIAGPKPDTASAIAFLQRWFPDSPWVLTSIIPDGKTDTRTFQPAQAADAARWIEERQGVQNQYFHVNPVRRDLNVKASKEDIARLAWLHVDIDPRAGEDHDQERERALKLLREYKLKPTVIVDSGGGFQGFWRLNPDPKLEINGVVTRAQELEAYNIQLERIFGADHCHNVDRIMRIPGTINVPTSRKLKKGRKATLATLVEWNDDCQYDIDQFTPAVRVQTKEPGLVGGQPKVRITGNVPAVGTDELKEWARQNGKVISDHTLALIATGQDPLDPGKYGSRSEALFKVCCDLVRAEVPEEMIFAVITGPNEIAASVREKRGWEAYAVRQIERAQEEAIDPHLRELNEKHAVIGDIGGKCRIISEVYDTVMERHRISKQSFEDFRNRYNNRRVQIGVDQQSGNPIFKPLGTWWTLHPARRQYDTIVFAPNKEVMNAYNLWRGFACDALPGDRHVSYLEHIRDNVCSGNLEHYNYVIGWMARAVQKPDCPGEVAVVLRGKRGTGKSKFAKVFGRLFGRHFLQVSDSKHLVGSFNAHLRDTVLLFGDEAFFAGDKKHEGVLKTLITEESLIIEGKGIDAEAAPNFTHTILASNEDWVVPAGLDERRFLMMEVGDGQKQNHDYFKRIDADLDNGGLENLLYLLMHYDLSTFEVRKVPQTKALQDQKLLSMGPEVHWMYEKIWDGRLLERDDTWRVRVLKDRVYTDYILEMDRRRVQYRLSRTNFSRFLQRCCPEGQLVAKQEMSDVPTVNEAGYEVMERKRAYVYYFPSLDVMRLHWDNHFGGPYDWPAWEGQQEALEAQGDEADNKPPF